MILDTSADSVRIIDSVRDLKPRHASQIQFWGFHKVGESEYQLDTADPGNVLLRLVPYLERENLPFSLSDTCKQYLAGISEQMDQLNELMSAGRSFKDGDTDQTRFLQFHSFAHDNLVRPLKQHQLKAAYHLYLVENGANFSVPGSGKTGAVLTVYEKLRAESKVNFLFVIGPPACFEPWQTEFELTLGRKPTTRILAGGNQSQRRMDYYAPTSQTAELYLTTFQTLLNDFEHARVLLSRAGNLAFLVVDEAHYIKQLGGSWAGAVLNIAQYAARRCVLTGTPIPRSYSDVFNMFDLLWPGRSPLKSDVKLQIRVCEEQNQSSLAKDTLQRSIGPLFYRVRKQDLGLLPQVFHSPVVIPMHRYERQIYDAIRTSIASYAKEDYMISIDLVRRLRRGRIIRLRQCTSYVGLLLTALDDYDEDLLANHSSLASIIRDYDMLESPAKLERLLALIHELQAEKQKTVIWAHFRGSLRLIVKCLTEAGIKCKLIYGDTPIEQTSVKKEENREQIRAEFVNPTSGLDVLVANPAACGESISLHKTCYHAIYYDLSYNCAQYLQSLDRIHRVGGSETNVANYHFLQYQDSVDQDIKSNLDTKAARMYEVVDDDYSIHSLDMFEDDDDFQAYGRLFGTE